MTGIVLGTFLAAFVLWAMLQEHRLDQLSPCIGCVCWQRTRGSRFGTCFACGLPERGFEVHDREPCRGD